MSPLTVDKPMPGGDADLAVLADLVATIGTTAFPGHFMRVLGALCGSDFCSAFRFDRPGVPRVLFAEGAHPDIPAFAQIASIGYAREYWKRDLPGRQLQGATPRIFVMRVGAAGISDPQHRHDCYDRAGIGERLSLCRAGAHPLLANGYRLRSAGPFRLADVERVERCAPLLVAAIDRHDQLSAGARAPDTVRLLMTSEGALSGREAEVASAIIHGHTHDEVAAALGLSPATVITYRRRAYQKLGVGNRRELARLVDTMRGGASFPRA